MVRHEASGAMAERGLQPMAAGEAIVHVAFARYPTMLQLMAAAVLVKPDV